MTRSLVSLLLMAMPVLFALSIAARLFCLGNMLNEPGAVVAAYLAAPAVLCLTSALLIISPARFEVRRPWGLLGSSGLVFFIALVGSSDAYRWIAATPAQDNLVSAILGCIAVFMTVSAFSMAISLVSGRKAAINSSVESEEPK